MWRIDQFVIEKLDEKGLTINAGAGRHRLARRLALDIIGLRAGDELLGDFLNDDSEKAYRDYVDRLLASRHFGEHQARFWLDAARYGDTHGLHFDNYREMWLYRDWVVDAFNNDMPFDQFGIEQLAGDLLDEPTDFQLIATGFLRNNVTSAEGGSIAEELRVRYVNDRTETFGTVFLGLMSAIT